MTAQPKIWLVNEQFICIVQVCNTQTKNKIENMKTRRKRETTLTEYYEKETMFILSLTSASIYNSAPVLDGQTKVNIMEDSGNEQILSTFFFETSKQITVMSCQMYTVPTF